MRVQVRLRVPEISVAMDAKEFEILQDVAAHLAGEQVRVHPTTPACWLSHLPFYLRASFFGSFTVVTGSLLLSNTGHRRLAWRYLYTVFW